MAEKDIFKDKWVPVLNVDPMKRKPKEWAKIYNIQLVDEHHGIWSEYEWAFHLADIEYYPLIDTDSNGNMLDTFDRSSAMEMRALELRRDLFMGADIGERHVLTEKKKYIETEWVNRKLNLL